MSTNHFSGGSLWVSLLSGTSKTCVFLWVRKPHRRGPRDIFVAEKAPATQGGTSLAGFPCTGAHPKKPPTLNRAEDCNWSIWWCPNFFLVMKKQHEANGCKMHLLRSPAEAFRV